MRKRISNYTFNKTAKTITFSEPLVLSQFILITDVTENVEIYNFSDPELGGSLIGDVLTLNIDTSALSDADELQIFIDEENVDFDSLTELLQGGLIEIIRQLQSIRNDGGMADVSGRVRVAIESSSTVPVSITSNQDLRNVTNINQNAGYALNHQFMTTSNQGWGNLRSRINVT